MDGWMDRWMDGRMDEYVEVRLLSGSLSSEPVLSCPIGAKFSSMKRKDNHR